MLSYSLSNTSFVVSLFIEFFEFILLVLSSETCESVDFPEKQFSILSFVTSWKIAPIAVLFGVIFERLSGNMPVFSKPLRAFYALKPLFAIRSFIMAGNCRLLKLE